MGESFDHRPTGGIRQSRKCCTQSIHNHMVVDYRPLSSPNFQSLFPIPCSLIRSRPSQSQRHQTGRLLQHFSDKLGKRTRTKAAKASKEHDYA